MFKIFIDGQVGTTGLQIQERLTERQDIELLSINDKHRKDLSFKHDLISDADVVVLCLPDDAARQCVELASDTKARILDASTAHRIHPDWVYGLPELNANQRGCIRRATRVSNPGCYPTGFLLPIVPLVTQGLLCSDIQLSISAVSGFSGGGRKMIHRYETRRQESPDNLWTSRPYGLKFGHKHIPEMQHYATLKYAPLFMPSVAHYHQGMLVSIPLARSFFSRAVTIDEVQDCLKSSYDSEACVRVHDVNAEVGLDQDFLDPEANNGTNRNDIYIYGDDEQMLLVSQLDNLGKGAAGAAVQNLNLMLGVDELSSLTV